MSDTPRPDEPAGASPPTGGDRPSLEPDDSGGCQAAAIPDTGGRQAAAIADRLTDLERAVQQLANRDAEAATVLEDVVAVGRHSTTVIDRLHEENQLLRRGEIDSALLPVLHHFMRVADDAGLMAETSGEKSDAGLLRDALLDALSRAGLEVFAPEAGTPFDRAVHAACGTVATDRPELQRTVAGVTRAGFRRTNGKVVRVAEVQLYAVKLPEHSVGENSAPAPMPRSELHPRDEGN